jgi:hypothetical protein
MGRAGPIFLWVTQKGSVRALFTGTPPMRSSNLG